MKNTNIYVGGTGEIAFGYVINKSTNTPGIVVTKIMSEPRKISSDILNKPEILIDENTIIYFKNLESLRVLEIMIKHVRLELKRQNKAL